MNIVEIIRKRWESSPLACAMYLAILFRILAIIFSKGFAMMDDHFLVAEVAQS